MITFNTCRSWWGGGQVNMVRDRAPKLMYNFSVNSSRYKPELCTGSYLLATVCSFQFRDRCRLQMLPVCCLYFIPRYLHVAVCTRMLLACCSYVSRRYSDVSVCYPHLLLVCYLFVTRMYPCGVLAFGSSHEKFDVWLVRSPVPNQTLFFT